MRIDHHGNDQRLVTEFARAAQEMVLAAVAQTLVTSSPMSGSSPSTTTKSSERPKPSKRAKLGPRRTSAQLDELGERFHEILCDHPGETMAVLVAKAGYSSPTSFAIRSTDSGKPAACARWVSVSRGGTSDARPTLGDARFDGRNFGDLGAPGI